jgi:2-(1,2-epoxy-1,2-dihydrophenyl)acetyl-CoA isomerase
VLGAAWIAGRAVIPALRAASNAEVVALASRARERAAALAARSPFAARRIKRLVREGLSRPLDEHLRAHAAALEECFRSADHAEGVTAFLERRAPAFTGVER